MSALLQPDLHPARSVFAHDLLAGLRQRQKSLSPKYFYDERGSALFDLICDLDEYYPTRTETALLRRHAGDIAAKVGPHADIVEFGAGSLAKIRLLLPALQAPRRFLPLDISADYLQRQAALLRADFPGLIVQPLAGDFSGPMTLPPLAEGAARRVGFFPGSSLGNFNPAEALAFLRQCATLLAGGGLLIGIDLVKAPERLHRAYNDAAGVTAAFNKNLLLRANHELEADFDLDAFDHYAYYHPGLQRIEMHLLSRKAQRVHVCGEPVDFAQGESIHTENSYKFTVPGFQALALQAGLLPAAVWCDEDALFSLHWLVAPTEPV
ncbi:L-histidine N(alpha)-methyltransferase [Aquabacterium soli]|uniref:L-histidine N(Alpha)-methyltransferase n=1 Tax=Aquabacterium soli TaxID=2493092 RepID=A0A3R8TCX6_9BURK|nr:L-histidine N(alpha)-methyltransferase [Aquabacterium soli]RRS04833.1 L-histidine N(alpha)-methyltransferase [Aquabacterium soli]